MTDQRPSLLRAEVHRFRSRRFIRILVLLALGGFVVGVVIAGTQFAKPSAAGLADAQRIMAEAGQQQEQFRQECLKQPQPPGQTAEQTCGPPFEASGIGVEDFMRTKPFVFADTAPGAAGGVAAGTAALLFLIGATWVGAEWSSKSMTALLFWEPRRLKVIATKLAVLLGAAALIGAAAQALWLLGAKALAATRGSTGRLPDGFYGDLLAIQARGVLLVVVAGALGFALANLVRNTGAALGLGFVYFAVVENAVRVLRPKWEPGLLTNNAAALVSKDGLRLYLNETHVDGQGQLVSVREIVLSHLHGGVVLVLTAAVLVAVGGVLFARRDLQ